MILESIPAVLLCRVASYAFASPLREGASTLDFSRLPLDDAMSALDRVDIAGLLQAFGVGTSGVSRLSLARNKLSRA